MRPVHQTRFDRAGNCLSACFASWLEVPLDAVDFSCFELEDWYEVANQRLRPFGVIFCDMKVARDERGDLVLALPLGTMFIASGPTVRSPMLHAVLCVTSHDRVRMLHDPHPSGAGLRSIQHVGLLVPDVGRMEIWAHTCASTGGAR